MYDYGYEDLDTTLTFLGYSQFFLKYVYPILILLILIIIAFKLSKIKKIYKEMMNHYNLFLQILDSIRKNNQNSNQVQPNQIQNNNQVQSNQIQNNQQRII